MSEEPTPHQRAAATKRGRTRLRILNAARERFDKHGYHAVTRDEIAAEAGVGVATLHNYFSTKQSIAIAAYATGLIIQIEHAEVDIEDNKPIEEVIREFVFRIAEYFGQQPVFAYALLPLAQDQRSSRGTRDTEGADFSLGRLSEFLGKLLARHDLYAETDIPVVEAAEFYLSGLLTWIVHHPERPGKDAAALSLAQLI